MINCIGAFHVENLFLARSVLCGVLEHFSASGFSGNLWCSMPHSWIPEVIVSKEAISCFFTRKIFSLEIL